MMIRDTTKLISTLLILVLICSIGMVTGCGKKKTAGPSAKESHDKAAKKIYFIVKASESEFWQIVIGGGKQAAEKLGVDLICQAPVSEADITKQIAILENAIATKPDAIVLAPTVSDALVPGIEKAAKKNIPVIIIDSAANTDQYVSFLASDNVKIGTLSADMLAKALEERFGKAEGEVGCLTFMSGVGSLEKRKKGFLDRLKEKYPGIKVVDFQDAMGKQGTSLSIVQNYLTAYPNLKGIFASNQHTGDEAVRALDMKSRKDLAVVAVDAGQQEVWGLGEGYVNSIIVQQPWIMGAMGVEYALKAARGEKIPKFVDTGIVAITPGMLKSGEAEEFLDPVKFHGKR